ncbi:MAG: Gfo/Idh/MocA family oxidoreductase, partial [Pseudomonadota bacterium]|nr:Gfo/Idh/MocA family oxidoreductase [Pseudomonadota bacterium]
RVVRELDALLDDPTIDLVVITTPNGSHFDYARRSLLADKHVVLEKPFTLTAAEAHELDLLAQQRKRVLSAHQNRRWDGDFLTVQRLLASGMLGRLVQYESHFDRYRPQPKPQAWRESVAEGGGVLFDLGTHLIDQTHTLFGAPRSVQAAVRSQRSGVQVDDSFSLTLHYDGLDVGLHAGMLIRTATPRFALYGTDGAYVKYGLDPQEDALKAGAQPSGESWGKEAEAHWGRLTTTRHGLTLHAALETLPGNYLAYYQNIADAICGKAELIVTAAQATLTMRIIEAARLSADEERTVTLAT